MASCSIFYSTGFFGFIDCRLFFLGPRLLCPLCYVDIGSAPLIAYGIFYAPNNGNYIIDCGALDVLAIAGSSWDNPMETICSKMLT